MTEAGLEARLGFRRNEVFSLDLSLAIAPGQTAALLGPNGAGKSTVVALLAGLAAVDQGHIRLAGTTLDDPKEDLFVPPETRRVGVLFQDYLLFPHLNVIDNVAFGLRHRGFKSATANASAQAWLEKLGIAGLARRSSRSLSGGEAQRVALARALATEPEVLLLDEPLAALDVTTRIELRRVLRQHLADFSGPRLLITHEPSEAFLLGDVIHVIENGRITQVGSADDIRLRPRTAYAAGLAGVNLVSGVAGNGTVDTGGHIVHIADHAIAGPVLVTIRLSAISIHLRAPGGSPRNVWRTIVEVVEHLGERTRVGLGGPLPLTAEVTTEAARSLDLRSKAQVWVSIKATEITVEPDALLAGAALDPAGGGADRMPG